MSERTLDLPLSDLLAAVDPGALLAPCGMSELVLGADATASLPALLTRALSERAGTVGTSAGAGADVVLLVDTVPISRAGEDLKDLVERDLGAHFAVRRVVLDDGQPQLHVVDPVLEQAARAVAGADAVVALGGGTVSDIAKVAAVHDEHGRRPFLVSVQTAASVDGFTDDVSVVLRDGVKRTVPSRWPDAVVADSVTIADAPATMNRAGFGEMTSMLVAPADWRLSGLVGVDSTYKQPSVDLLELVGADIADWAPGIASAEPAAVEQLTRALALRGVVTGVSGTTAVLSGVEHLVSHMLDQHHSQQHQPLGLHGAQVGVAGVLAAAAWELAHERLAASPRPTVRSAEELRRDGEVAVRSTFAAMDPTGRVGAECWADYSRKLDAAEAAAAAGGGVQALVDDWGTHAETLRPLARPSATMAQWLAAAGAPLTFADLDPVVGPDLGRWALTGCALMRNRFTVVDLLTALGWWTDEDVTEVLARGASAVAAAGAASAAR